MKTSVLGLALLVTACAQEKAPELTCSNSFFRGAWRDAANGVDLYMQENCVAVETGSCSGYLNMGKKDVGPYGGEWNLVNLGISSNPQCLAHGNHRCFLLTKLYFTHWFSLTCEDGTERSFTRLLGLDFKR